MKTTCEFRFGFWDVTARGDAHFAVSQNQDYARIEDINAEDPIVFPNVATLEPDFGFPLDGSKEWLPDNARLTQWGWWSTDLSGGDLTFSNPPTLTVTFYNEDGTPTPHSSAGITFTFVATLPKTVNIKWYGYDGGLLADKDFTPDRFDYFCDWQVEDYYKVVVTVKSMKYAHRFFRASSILFGVLEILDDARVTSANLTEEISPVALTLPINKAEVSFYTPNSRFALLDPAGAYRLFQWKQELTAYKTVDSTRTMLGKYYLQEATGTVDAVTALSCVDMIGVLDTVEYKGGIYEKTPVSDLLDDILTPENVEFELDKAFDGVTLTGYLAIGSKRTALQQIAFAIGAVVDTARTEIVRFYPAPSEITKTITPERKIVGHKITMEALVTQVDITAHQYTLITDEVKELNKATFEVGEHTVTFSSPVSVTSVSGAAIVEKHPNYCTLNVTKAGEVILSGYGYEDTKTVYTVKTEPLPAGAKASAKSVTSATLVDPGKAQDVARRLYDYYQLRYTDEGQILPGQEQAAERAEVSSLGGRTLTGYIQRVVTDLSGGGLETITLRGR